MYSWDAPSAPFCALDRICGRIAAQPQGIPRRVSQQRLNDAVADRSYMED